MEVSEGASDVHTHANTLPATDLLAAYYAQYGHPDEEEEDNHYTVVDTVHHHTSSALDTSIPPPPPEDTTEHLDETEDSEEQPSQPLPSSQPGYSHQPPPPQPSSFSELGEDHADTFREPVRVENWLLDMGEGYKDHLGKLRADRIREELMSIQDKPTITEHARQLTRGGVPVEERLLKEHAKKRQQQERQRGEEETDPQCTHTPVINERSREKTSRWANDLTGAKKEVKLRQLRARALAAEQEQMKEHPSIDSRSARMAANRTNGMTVEDHLLFADKQHKQDMFERHERDSLKGIQGHPNITRHAASLKRDGDVTSRLYSMRLGGSLMGSTLEQFALDVASQKDKGVVAALHNRGITETFEPAINEWSGGGSPRDPKERIEERLFKLYEGTKKSNAAKAEAIEEEIKQASRTKHTTKQSEVIYSLRELDRAEGHRLHNARNREEEVPKKKISDAMFLLRLQEWEAQREKRKGKLQAKQQELKRETMRECTFDPSKSPSMRRMRRKSVTRPPVTEGSLADRSTSWTVRRQTKLAQQKKAKEKDQTAGCSFVPYINKVCVFVMLPFCTNQS